MEELSHYWGTVRQYYSDFESDIKSPNTEIYKHEMPGGQYSNLRQQAKSLGYPRLFACCLRFEYWPPGISCL